MPQLWFNKNMNAVDRTTTSHYSQILQNHNASKEHTLSTVEYVFGGTRTRQFGRVYYITTCGMLPPSVMPEC